MTEEQQAAIVEFALGRMSREALEQLLCVTLDDDGAIADLLNRAIASRDGKHVQCALLLAFGVWGIHLDAPGGVDIVPALLVLLRAPWCTSHEDVALVLQWRRDARAIDALFETALTKFPYLDHDNSYPLARKCTWALADIGTPEARAKLGILAATDDPEIAGYAQRRLDRWDAEISRKGPR
ncbi:MAG TPA: hypothetical protein VL326_08120 [Kofleriaceae bacterium]|nr:hypothetical protein [Kofleriaceae bacterium]